MTDATVNLPEWRRTLAERGGTLTELAADLGTPLWTVYAYAQGKRTPSADWQTRAEAAARRLGRAPESAA